MSREVRLTIARINQLPPFTGTLNPNDLVAFFDVSTGITHKIKVSEIGAGAQGTTDHSQLTIESRALPDQHPIGAVAGLQGELDALFASQQTESTARIAKDDSLQEQILTMQDEINFKLANRVERGITIDGGSVAVVRDYYSSQSNITETTGRGVTLIERSNDNITFVTATPPFNVTGDIWWRFTPSAETSFVKIKGQLV